MVGGDEIRKIFCHGREEWTKNQMRDLEIYNLIDRSEGANQRKRENGKKFGEKENNFVFSGMNR